jgi:hypothetical protein
MGPAYRNADQQRLLAVHQMAADPARGGSKQPVAVRQGAGLGEDMVPVLSNLSFSTRKNHERWDALLAALAEHVAA